MPFRSLLASWLEKSTNTADGSPAEPPKVCHLGVVFALGIESGCFEDLLSGCVTIRGHGFIIREGGWNGCRVAVILAGPGRENAARATEVLIDGHRPSRVISAGFAGGLSPTLKRNDILVVDRLVCSDGREMAVELAAGLANQGQEPGVHRGVMLTYDRMVRSPDERRTLGERYEASAVDMETFAVAEVCRQREIRFSAVRVINDTDDESLSTDIEYLLTRKPGAAQWGAALGTICRRPSSAKEMYQLHENALVASRRLAKFLAAVRWE